MIKTMEELLNKIDDTNTAHTRHIKTHDSEGNKKYWKKLCKALDKDMKDIDIHMDDIRDYSEYIENHKEN